MNFMGKLRNNYRKAGSIRCEGCDDIISKIKYMRVGHDRHQSNKNTRIKCKTSSSDIPYNLNFFTKESSNFICESLTASFLRARYFFPSSFELWIDPIFCTFRCANFNNFFGDLFVLI